MQCKNNIKQYLLLFTHKNGNGYAVVNATDPKVAENVFKAQTKYEDAGITSIKELRWFGQEMQLVEEGSVVTYGLSLYDLAVYNGYKGTLLEFMESMRGPSGVTVETDPIFSASPAATITDEDIDNWNNPSGGELSNWDETDTDSLAYIKNKPTIPTVPTNVSAFNNDAGYLTQHQSIKTVNNESMVGSGNLNLLPTDVFNNFCPIIEDTRSSVVTAITGVAPFASLVDGQRIVLKLNYNASNGICTLDLTLSNNTTTGAKNIKGRYNSSFANVGGGYPCYKNDSLPLVYNSDENAWLMLGVERNNTYSTISQSHINAGTSNSSLLVTPILFHDNAYIVEETYSSGSLKANKMYDFGTVSSLTIPSLDATNDLVSNALNFYALRFIAGADNLSITFPTGVIVDDEPTINTGDYVEIMINLYVENNTNHFYASIKVWQAQ